MIAMKRRKTFDGARCLVTGASSGLGRAFAESLARKGARVLLTGRSELRLQAVKSSLVASGVPSDRLAIQPADLTVEADRAQLISTASATFDGALDVAINAAGIGAAGHFDSHPPDVLRRVFEINVFALAELSRLLRPLLMNGDSPSLINIGSIVARRGLPGRSEYAASKFAVAGFTESIRAEWAIHDIHVLLLNPGFTATEFDANLVIDTARVKVSDRRIMIAAAVAEAGLRAVLKGKHESTLTREGRLLLLVNRLFPRFVDRGFARWTRKIYADVLVPHPPVSKPNPLPPSDPNR